ncbi:MAG: hypothetical protein M5R42_04980 [Rhodocyclaceae bacterium]|nr:hypothetical protein [Rhodocyclaceae bacterium]
MSANWNISLFHYRNHGGDIGRVLVGMQGAAGRQGGVSRLPQGTRLRQLGRNRQSGLQDVPRRVRAGSPRACSAGVSRC